MEEAGGRCDPPGRRTQGRRAESREGEDCPKEEGVASSAVGGASLLPVTQVFWGKQTIQGTTSLPLSRCAILFTGIHTCCLEGDKAGCCL